MKKLLSFVLSFVVLMSSVACVIEATYTPIEMGEKNLVANQEFALDMSFQLGDIDSDGNVNAVDFWMMRATILGLGDYVETMDTADFDADNEISAKDSYYMRLCLSGVATPDDYESGYQLYRLTIAGNDISEFSIVIEDDCLYSDNEYMAAELFREYIAVANGTELSIVRENDYSGFGIYIHDVEKDSDLGNQLGAEGYKYEVANGSLHIYGTDRGNMYAAFEILEDYLGFGFVDNLFTFLRKQRTVDLEEGLSVIFVPGYRFRQSKSTYNTNEGYRERFSIPRGINGTPGIDFKNAKKPLSFLGDFVGPVGIDIHSMNYYYQMATGTMPDESYGTLSERYYAKLQSGIVKNETTWEPCATLESEYELLFAGLLDYIDWVTEARGFPFNYEDGTNCFSFSPCDNVLWCTCRNCRAAANRSSYVDIYLNLKNKGAEDIQKYYPGLKLYSLMYEKECPVEVLPSEHLILVLGGTSCANHPLGTDEECYGNGFYRMSNKEFEQFIIDMGALCSQTGAELWMWYYPETNNWWLYDIPNIHSIYYDVTWLYDHGITGFYYEGHNLCPGYMFENLKAYMFSQIAFDPEMSLEEYDALIKDYLYMTYGQGYEYIWEFLEMYEEAGDMAGYENGNTQPYCFVGNYDRAFDVVSFEYIRENYEYMRELLMSAIEAFDPDKTQGAGQRYERLYKMFCVFELLGLGATYVPSYVNGDELSRAIYEDRYAWVYEYYYESGMRYYVYIHTGIDRPATFNLDSNPFIQFTAGSIRSSITKQLKGN
ncbi:MAG: DUF4838 domain-containing protein [Ruminococcaceae bacterium]|nr:DUF4838 domain-containing protein [Oscillospiraceae bacterium]